MNDTARDSINYQPADTQGLDDLFVPIPKLAPDENPILSQDEAKGAIENPNGLTETPESFTVQEVVKLLGVPRSTVYRHVRSGKYQTIQGPDGKLRIQLRRSEIPALSQENTAETSNSLTETSNTTAEIVETTVETTETLTENPSVSVDIDGIMLKLEAATYRIGYLEAQLESERKQVKLLTDSQHKPGWWTRFCTWFMGQNR